MNDFQTNTSPDNSVKYAWSSIVKNTRNHGNWLIESSLRQLLLLPEPEITFDSYQPLDDGLVEKINTCCSFVLNPGCTTLQSGENAAYQDFDRIKIPKPCFGGCLWQMGIAPKILLAAKALAPSAWSFKTAKSADPDLSIARKMSEPIGTRDPYTQSVLQKAGIESVLIGCPTLLSPKPVTGWRTSSDRRLLISLSRYSLPEQIRLIWKIARSWDVRLLIHEEYERQIIRFLPRIKTVAFESSEQFFSQYREADMVITGRLHGVLPALRYGTPVVFYGSVSDTRFSLLNFLGVPIRKLSTVLSKADDLKTLYSPAPEVFEKINELRCAFVKYARGYGIQTKTEPKDEIVT